MLKPLSSKDSTWDGYCEDRELFSMRRKMNENENKNSWIWLTLTSNKKQQLF